MSPDVQDRVKTVEIMEDRKKIIRIASRESRLAVIQAELVRERILKSDPGIRSVIVTMKTTGDRIQDRTLDTIGGKGLFVRELDEALREFRADISVHSLKDMPKDIPEDLPLLAYSDREDPRDVCIFTLHDRHGAAEALDGLHEKSRGTRVHADLICDLVDKFLHSLLLSWVTGPLPDVG